MTTWLLLGGLGVIAWRLCWRRGPRAHRYSRTRLCPKCRVVLEPVREPAGRGTLEVGLKCPSCPRAWERDWREFRWRRSDR